MNVENSFPDKVNSHSDLQDAYKSILEGVFQQEYHNIRGWLKRIVDDAVTIESVQKKQALDICMGKWHQISDILKTTFCAGGKRTWDDSMIKQFSSLVKKCPTNKEVSGWLIGTICATLLEITVFILMIFYQDSSPYTLIPAVLLAIGSLLSGWALGKLIFYSKTRKLEKTDIEDRSVESIDRGKTIGFLFLGLLIVLGMSTFRAIKSPGNPLAAFGFAMLLAIAIIVCEAMHTDLKNVKERSEKNIYDIQTIYSYTEHHKMITESAWREHYRSIVDGKLNTLFSLLEEQKIQTVNETPRSLRGV